MSRDRDVAAFGDRAQGYDEGWRGRMHHQIADRTVDLALTCVPATKRILDTGCGTGYLIGQLAARAPQAEFLAGIDAAPAMIEVARAAAADDRLHFVVGTAERLPWPAASFDQVISTTSFDHWADQRAGLAESARVLAPGGCLVLADLFSSLLLPTLLAGRRGKARTRRRAAPSSGGSGIALTTLVSPVCRHHPGSDGDEIAADIKNADWHGHLRDRFCQCGRPPTVNYAPAHRAVSARHARPANRAAGPAE